MACPLLTPGAGAVDLGRRVKVVAIDAVGVGDVLQIHHGSQRHHRSGGVARFQLGDVGRMARNGASACGDDFVGSAEIVEIVDVIAAQIDLQRLEDIGDRDVLLLGLGAIDVGIQLRHTGAESGEQPGESRDPCSRRR